ncbi:MAG: flagellar biosynthesis anti-sigma factor FlgM [Selenomonadaceae bacterium]|nr:flagellar biosynthesis anti-sigma factor FlgM [Selenomonadaceae bacterium]MBR4696098.1 flagellar biosynthesis anti-sigma factor FlgM [Selenomonadaceae bacterium]
MYINNNVQSIAGAYALNSATPAKRTSTAAPASFKDEVHLSSEAQSFHEMLKELKGMDDVRQDKVDFYTAAIENGSYDVSAANIASRMMSLRF